MNDIKAVLKEGLNAIPLLDVHTHLDAAHLTARGLHDLLLYHMLISDLASAGCPSRARLSEDPCDAEAETRLVEAVPYLQYVQNTSISWGLRIILGDLYNWTEPVTTNNWRSLDARIRQRSNDSTWGREILQRAGIQRSSTELWRRRDGSADDIFQYSLEWAFFTRAQWGVFDAPLYELECAWNQEKPGAPLPVTLGARPPLARTIHNLQDVHAAIHHYVERIPYDQIISTAQHFSTDIHYRLVSEAEMTAALARRAQATPADQDIYASYILETFLGELEEHGKEIVYHFSIGAEPLPYETGSKLRQETIFELAAIISRHPRLHFQALLASEHANQALCTLARELPNLSLAGYWWHNFFPGIMRKIINDRLDMLPANKQVGFFSDAYCLEWAYAKAALVRAQWVDVLSHKVEQGQYTLDMALSIARQVLYETPQELLGITPLKVEG